MTDPWFISLCALIAQTTGVVIEQDKQYLAESRLSPLVARFGAANIRDLVAKAGQRERSELGQAVIEAMMTGETLFFRDLSLFTEIRTKIIPELIAQCSSRKTLRIWCPACSTGQEPYSIAMLLDEYADELAGWQVDIIGSDVSPQAIRRATSGLYNQFEVQRGLAVKQLLRHFEQDAEIWRINKALRSRVTFETGNLLHGRDLGDKFDLVMCRNVLIYFDPPTRNRALQALDHHISENGFLIFGTSETSIFRNPKYESSCTSPAIYRKRSANAAGLTAVA